MTPKKAIVIVSALFLATAIVFVLLFVNSRLAPDQPVSRQFDNNIISDSTNQIKLTPEQQKIKDIEIKTKDQVEKIVEQGRTATGGVTLDAQKKIDEAVNQEIMEKLKLRTPGQVKADEQRQIDQEKLDQQINQQIKSQMQNK